MWIGKHSSITPVMFATANVSMFVCRREGDKVREGAKGSGSREGVRETGKGWRG